MSFVEEMKMVDFDEVVSEEDPDRVDACLLNYMKIVMDQVLPLKVVKLRNIDKEILH